MVVILFVMGRSGSGKSTSVRCITSIARMQGWVVENFDDYDILHSMFRQEILSGDFRYFRPTAHNGFKVIDASIFDKALTLLQEKIQQVSEIGRTLITIEFSRDNYLDSLSLFKKEILKQANFLFLATNLATCTSRIYQRAINPITKDDFFIEENVILEQFSCPYIPPYVAGELTKVIDNTGTPQELYQNLEVFSKKILIEKAVVPVGV